MIYAIGDLHLSLSVDKPMDVFGDNWTGYMNRIKEAWCETVTDEDTVLIPGDVCWAISLNEAKIDLAWIDDLPGRKIITRGNHDYWWETLKKMNPLFDSISFIHNSYEAVGDIAICGSRGWISPNDTAFTEQDEKIYNRECHRLKLSLDKAKADGFDKILVMLHYPPTNDKKELSPIQEILEDYGVSHVVYGHLHTKYCWHLSLKGLVNNVDYHFVSSDYLNFVPKHIDI
ncbi:serine/threonine protein phosphatase [Acidaminobacter sp. JC074]|uniref:metallophosphoesterase n=1 Tax=Acidaminobacter sp. JC074 TaxID=2530199 RepID=UPI001F0DCD25|nr:metallophosphoesterase [Acidaminobacter sp. JC074]MCH4891104.1 serine/threonine protein phosphatase [Acidaminobacter sp. JC074]